MQNQIFDILFNEDEITWQSMIYDLVREEQMDPWDVDISLLSHKFLDMLRKFKEMNFRVSGKILLAAAILLRLKSNRLVGEDLVRLDKLITSSEETAEEFYDGLEQELEIEHKKAAEQEHSLIPRTPQPRKRKVSVFDLVEALNKALEVKNRRSSRVIPPAPKVEMPTDHRDMSLIIRDVYNQIKDYFKGNDSKLTFSQLIPGQSKEDKVYTFIPLLHLDHQRKIELWQQEHFGEIEIEMLKAAG